MAAAQQQQAQPPLVPVAIPNHIGKCVDFTTYQNIAGQPGLVEINKQGYKIMGLTGPQLRYDDIRYNVRSNFGNGAENDIIFPREITNLYDCPANAAANPANNIQMLGGRKSRKARKHRKTRKGRKASKRKSTRKH